jgi:aldose 1-epimerase
VILELVAGPDRATVDSVAGGRLASLIAGGQERLLTRPQDGSALPSISWGSFLMAPWVGRISKGRLDWRGRQDALPRNLGGHAIHGAVFDRPWRLEHQDERAVELSSSLEAGRWPYAGRVSQRIALAPGRLRFEAAIEAIEAMPASLGWHPWFQRTDGDLAVSILAGRHLVLDDELIPSGASLPVGGSTDLRSGPFLDDRRLDDVFIDARGPAIVRWPDLELALEFEPPVATVVVFSPPGAVCVEPMTAWPDAIRLAGAGLSETGLVVLEPGATLAASMTWRW